jgi:hypothetical protein
VVRPNTDGCGSSQTRWFGVTADSIRRNDDGYLILIDILPRLKTRESHGTAPLSWDIVVYDVTRS